MLTPLLGDEVLVSEICALGPIRPRGKQRLANFRSSSGKVNSSRKVIGFTSVYGNEMALAASIALSTSKEGNSLCSCK